MDAERKGIVRYATEFRIAGIRCFWLGALIQTWRERRLLELAASGIQLVKYRISPVCSPDKKTHISEYDEVFLNLESPDGHPFVSRLPAFWSNGDLSVACEYGQPGARILVHKGDSKRVFSPYWEKTIWHLHAIAHYGDDLFLISTGDTTKALDLFRITPSECTRLLRLQRFLAGYTAMVSVNGGFWAGSDFSERANYVVNIETGKKFFLPKDSVLEYVVYLEALDGTLLLVITRRLAKFEGHALIFCTAREIFLASNAIKINEYCAYKTFSDSRRDGLFCPDLASRPYR